ncbi:MAG: IclR family transcriptional regulator, partial [Thermocrispum sp.]
MTKRPRNASAAGASAPPQYPIESVDNALRLLLLFEEEQQIRLTDVSRYLGVASSTAHRLLAILQYRGFVRQNPATRCYEPGPSLSSIAFFIMRHLDVRARARPTLERLNKEFGETVHLSRLEGTGVNFLDAIESIRAVRVGSRIGRALPAHCTSSGKAMLSVIDVYELNRL